MQLAGFIKNSFVDYPGYIAAIVFVPGCNMDCWYCHNKQLWKKDTLVDNAQVDEFFGHTQRIHRRRGDIGRRAHFAKRVKAVYSKRKR